MTPIQLIGISGEMGTGKDTVAGILVSDYGFTQVSVGKHIRRELSKADWLLSGKIIPNSVRQLLRQSGSVGRLESLYRKPTSPNIREALDWFGQMWLETQPYHWINQIHAEIMDLGVDKVVWSDIRTEDEYRKLEDWGGQRWLIKRPVVKRAATYIKQLINPPELHKCLGSRGFEFDVIITNSASKGVLRKKIDKYVEEFYESQKS